jgi:3-oxoacyl-[acyl-carrier protein] reductase
MACRRARRRHPDEPMAGPSAAHAPSSADRVAVVTGASRGIGAAIARRLASDGARVALVARDRARLKTVAAEIERRGGDALSVVADLTDESAVDDLFERIDRWADHIDFLVNNAAAVYGTEAPLLELTTELWDAVMAANLRTTYLCTVRAARRMASAGSGAILNISAASAQRAHRAVVAYDTTKGGVDAFTRAAALDLAPYGIRVNAVAPGPIVVEAWGALPAGEIAKRSETVPLARLGTPDDIAAAVAFLCSSEAGYITGQVLAVDGGLLAQLRPPQVEIVEAVAR